jgi:hypothetical protein
MQQNLVEIEDVEKNKFFNNLLPKIVKIFSIGIGNYCPVGAYNE